MGAFVLLDGDEGGEFVSAGLSVGEGDAGVFDALGEGGHGRELLGASPNVRTKRPPSTS